MAAVPITIVGIETKDDGTSGQVTIVGMASLTGLGVGGGPIMPPDKPPGIWGPTDPRPTPPIYLPPIIPGGPPINIGAHPEHPIVLPPPPPDTTPSPPGMAVKPPPDAGGWAYVQPWGWGYFPSGATAGPKV